MADKKAPAPKKTHPAEPVIIMFFVAAVLGAIIIRFNSFIAQRLGLARFFEALWLFLQGEITFAELIGATGHPWIATLLLTLKILSMAFSVFMVWAIVFAYRKFNEVNAKIHEPLHPPHGEHHEVGHIGHDAHKPVNPKWDKVLEHINSPNPSDWKLAILEADIILNDMLDKMGYHGTTMGDKLKSIEPSDFSTLQEAWEAHKIRNSIAHEGSSYEMNKPEAERVIKLFKKVFEEFHFI